MAERYTIYPEWNIYPFIYTPSYSISYLSVDTGSQTIFTSSFAKITVNSMQTFSGKIDTLRVYKKNLTSDLNYTFVGDFPADPTELFISSSNATDNFIGIFDSIGSITHWTTASIDGSQITVDQPYLNQNNSVLFNSMEMSQSQSVTDKRFKVFPKNTNLTFIGNHEYMITANFVGIPENNVPAELIVYMSGSAFNHTQMNDQLGKRVSTLTTNNYRNFGQHQLNFISDTNGIGALNFQIVSGKWYVSEISIFSAFDSGFNPDEITIYVPLDNIKRNEIATFRIEFLNSKREASPSKIETTLPILLKNNPVYIELDDNIITGSITIGSGINDGILLEGRNAPTIRSNQYTGFQNAVISDVGGFAFYSGSPSDFGDSIFDPYRGVGFELHTGTSNSGSLAFRYDPISGSYLIISASIYALPGSNIPTGSGGSGTSGTSGTSGVDGTSGVASQSFESQSIWNFNHNLNSEYVIIQVYDTSYLKVIPDIIELIDANNANIYFNIDFSGTAIASIGGISSGSGGGSGTSGTSGINGTSGTSGTSGEGGGGGGSGVGDKIFLWQNFK